MKPNKIETIFVVSKGKPETATVYDWFRNNKFNNVTTVLSHDDDIKAYAANYHYPGFVWIKAPKEVNSLSKKREWLIKQFAKKGQWVFIVNDNVIKVTAVPTNIVNPEKADYKNEITPKQLLKIVNADIKRADAEGACVGGFACNENHFFRTRHYRNVGFIWGKMCYFKNSGMEWDHTYPEMEDYTFTAQALLHAGRVLVNNFVYPICKRYEAIGGTGNYEKRLPNKLKAAAHLVKDYKGLYRFKQRPGLAPDSEVQMRFNNLEQVEAWRMQMLNITNLKNIYIKT